MPSNKRRTYKFALSGVGAVQPDFDTPMPDAALNVAWNVTSDTLPTLEEELTRILDCTQQDLTGVELQRRFARWSFDFEADPALLAPAVAYLAGVAGAPTGTPRNQIFTLTIANATGGSFFLKLAVGTRQKPTAPIPYNFDAATLKRALENLTAIGRGQLTVINSGGGVFTIEVGGNLQRGSLGAITADVTALAGVGASVGVAVTQTAIQRAHLISRMTGDQPPPWSAVIGSEKATTALRKWVSLVLDTLRIGGGRATPRLTASATVAGSAEPHYSAAGFVLPTCQIFRAVRFLDCDLLIDGLSYQDNNLWRSFELRAGNGLITDEDANTDRDEDIHRAERADVRPFVIDATILGDENDDLYQAAKFRDEVPVSLRIGRLGNNVTFAAAKALLSLRTPDIVFDGTARRSAIALSIEPELIPGNTATPWQATANVGQSATLLTPAV
jgi:hypothetical protein